MTTDPASMPQAMPTRGKPWFVGLMALLLFGVLAAGVAIYGIRDTAGPAPAQTSQRTAVAVQGTITRIEMPYDDPPIPPGPHREEFRVACTVCHSPRLVFTQPALTQKQWDAVVHKMVAVYGAPLSAEEEKQIVAYLQAVQGK
jgi:mono/diheme cytochrome c family protein